MGSTVWRGIKKRKKREGVFERQRKSNIKRKKGICPTRRTVTYVAAIRMTVPARVTV